MSKNKIRIVLAQLNLFVGDIEGNVAKMINAAKKARDELGAKIIVFPELSITGYPPEDLLLRPGFINEAEKGLAHFQKEVREIYCIVGHPKKTEEGLYNACSVIYNNTILGCCLKKYLPHHGVFDEWRYFIPGNSACVIPILGVPIGIMICEDIWYESHIQKITEQGALIVLSLNASPFEIDKHKQRHLTLAKRTDETHLPIIYVNMVGGQDELVFDGGSMVVNQKGEISEHAGFFNETLLPVDIEIVGKKVLIESKKISIPKTKELIYEALKCGVRDYVHKNGFKEVLIGVSGGIDSALTLAIAVDALGKENVTAILMPSRYTENISMEDALILIKNLGVSHEIISIEPVFKSFLESLEGNLNHITEQNLQARARAVLLMARSNKTGKIVLTTGNRSELAVGYTTLYGDMAGGLCVLKDIPKTCVYQLVDYRNKIKPIIPQRIRDRPPTAELALDQKDEDTLPPYSILDPILALYVDQEKSIEDIVSLKFDSETVKKVVNLIHKSEYKRRQSPIGIRIHHKAFGRDRRYPVSSGFKE